MAWLDDLDVLRLKRKRLQSITVNTAIAGYSIDDDYNFYHPG
jgi:hypothetical protein